MVVGDGEGQATRGGGRGRRGPGDDPAADGQAAVAPDDPLAADGQDLADRRATLVGRPIPDMLAGGRRGLAVGPAVDQEPLGAGARPRRGPGQGGPERDHRRVAAQAQAQARGGRRHPAAEAGERALADHVGRGRDVGQEREGQRRRAGPRPPSHQPHETCGGERPEKYRGPLPLPPAPLGRPGEDHPPASRPQAARHRSLSGAGVTGVGSCSDSCRRSLTARGRAVKPPLHTSTEALFAAGGPRLGPAL